MSAEPMPSRSAAIATGTGEVDAVYHGQQKDDLSEYIRQGRLRPYEELASTLTTW
ncbi:NgoMIV family type II restriction endonuclease [Streptomyces chartreusis]|uniref:NgoMIV family type II restriction endonuclease n=1 Tax=Streptomyces chartreusis TaxID=1969 RepID=UPI0033A28F99